MDEEVLKQFFLDMNCYCRNLILTRIFKLRGITDTEPDLPDFLADQAVELSFEDFSMMIGEFLPALIHEDIVIIYDALRCPPLDVTPPSPSTPAPAPASATRALVPSTDRGLSDSAFIMGGDDGVSVNARNVLIPFLGGRAATVAAAAALDGALAGAHRTARPQRETADDNLNAENAAILRYTSAPAPSHPSTAPPAPAPVLPIHAYRETLLAAVASSQVVVVEAPTGSGKSTQLPQFIADSGLLGGGGGRVLCTQPRRVAAVSLASRVAAERGEAVGRSTGYKIRFAECLSADTKIVYLTDGILLRQLASDPDLTGVGCVILDEVHERALTTDVILALIRRLIVSGRRPDLRVVVASATLDAQRFRAYFNTGEMPALVSVPGRTYPVAIHYHTSDEPDFVRAAATHAARIHMSDEKGDILVFLPGADEISLGIRICKAIISPPGAPPPPQPLSPLILPIYAALPTKDQRLVFDPAPAGTRKIIFATNIAETSLTIDGIVHVVDAGFAKIKLYDPRTGADTLTLAPISRQQAGQRAGRAGRTQAGTCHRMYSESFYNNEMRESQLPEIQRSNLSSVVLSLYAAGVGDITHLVLLDPPAPHMLRAALARLFLLGALTGAGTLAPAGARLAKLPVEPELGRMLLAAEARGVLAQACVVAGMLSAQSPFYRPDEHKAEADSCHAAFADSSGDHITLYRVFSAWHKTAPNLRNAWCARNYLHPRAFEVAADVNNQLYRLFHPSSLPPAPAALTTGERAGLVRAVAAGLALNAAIRAPGGEAMVTVLTQQEARIHPSSAIAGAAPPLVVFSELFVSSGQYLRMVTRVRAAWLVEDAPRAFATASSGTVTQAAAAATIAPTLRSYESGNSWRASTHIALQKAQGKRRH